MATHTTYYNLTKPSANDKVNIGVLNNNADIIDTALHNKAIPNPTGETTDTLSSIEIDGTKYGISGGGDIDELKDRVNANAFGTAVDITSYNSSSNAYTFPTDGYVELTATVSDSSIVFQIKDGPVISASSNAFNSIFVKKGMSAYVSSNVGNGVASFKPLTDIVPLIPIMTSDTTPSGVASSKGGAYSSTMAVYKAFDRDMSTEFGSALTNQNDDYIEYDFGLNVTIEHGLVRWTSQSQSVVFKGIKIDISTDGTNYTTVYSDNPAQSQLDYNFVLSSPVVARYVRCHQVGGRWGGGDNRMIIRELQYYGKPSA